MSRFDIIYNFVFQTVTASYNKQGAMSVDEAKVAFLKAVYRWPTFGCAFFEVKVRAAAAAARHTDSALSLYLWSIWMGGRLVYLTLSLSVSVYHADCAPAVSKRLWVQRCFTDPPLLTFSPANVGTEFPRYRAHSHQQAGSHHHPPKNQGEKKTPKVLTNIVPLRHPPTNLLVNKSLLL